ncbi:MAG: hypothetical protein HQL38_20420 [Alphaproteobacteria bacterium]|nr:hypothetical protein [Alphaproteobacteria bacterium]
MDGDFVLASFHGYGNIQLEIIATWQDEAPNDRDFQHWVRLHCAGGSVHQHSTLDRDVLSLRSRGGQAMTHSEYEQVIAWAKAAPRACAILDALRAANRAGQLAEVRRLEKEWAEVKRVGGLN